MNLSQGPGEPGNLNKALPGLSDGPLMGGGPKKKLPTQTIVLIVVLAVSGASLLTMRQLATRSGMNMVPVNLPKELLEHTNASTNNNDYERVMTDLQRIQEPLDIALGKLGASPFAMPRSLKAGPEVPDGDAATRAEAAKRKRLQDAFDKLQLQSVLGGAISVARISGQSYRVGDVIDGTFKVESIGGRSVELKTDDSTFTLEMGAGKPGPGGKGAPGGKPASGKTGHK